METTWDTGKSAIPSCSPQVTQVGHSRFGHASDARNIHVGPQRLAICHGRPAALMLRMGTIALTSELRFWFPHSSVLAIS
jgi:hypothetical protein